MALTLSCSDYSIIRRTFLQLPISRGSDTQEDTARSTPIVSLSGTNRPDLVFLDPMDVRRGTPY